MPSESRSAADDLFAFVTSRVLALQGGYANNTSSATATLAHLRATSPTDPGAEPRTWSTLFEGLPTSLVGRGDSASWGESAVTAALHLYATHQQGRPRGVHRPGQRLGSAVRELGLSRGGPHLDDGVVDRFHRLSLMTSHDRRVYELRALIRMLRSEGVGLDYGSLATDLYWSMTPDGASRVRLRWARDLHRRARPGSDAPADPTSTTSPHDEQE